MKTILLFLISSLSLQYVYRQTTYVVVDENEYQISSGALLIKFSGIIQKMGKPEFLKLNERILFRYGKDN